MGVTQDFMLTKKKHADMLEPFSKRAFNVEEFLGAFDKDLQVELYPLQDGLGPYNQAFDSVIVSRETEAGGKMINDKRAEEHLPPLSVVIVDLVQDEKQQEKVSSTHFRKAMSEIVTGEQLEFLKDSWRQSLQQLDIHCPSNEVWLWRLFKLYCQPWRKYHTLAHIVDLCQKIDKTEGLKDAEKAFLKMAAFFHDAIYIPSSKLNEKVAPSQAEVRRSAAGVRSQPRWRAEVAPSLGRPGRHNSGHGFSRA